MTEDEMVANPYSETLGREWTDVEMAQSRVRLVRLDAEGNPVDGSDTYLKITDAGFQFDTQGLDDSLQDLMKLKRTSITTSLENLSPETIKLLMGEG